MRVKGWRLIGNERDDLDMPLKYLLAVGLASEGQSFVVVADS